MAKQIVDKSSEADNRVLEQIISVQKSEETSQQSEDLSENSSIPPLKPCCAIAPLDDEER